MPFKLKSINLENIHQATVVSSASNVSCSYGRRFTVALGDDSKDVVLNDLFERAKKLQKSASTARELYEVHQFIEKLKAAEVVAAKTYKDRGCIYKIRTWFHRLFGAAFLGSHLDRLQQLVKKVHSKQDAHIEAFKTFFQQNQPNFKSFTNKSFEFQLDGQIYVIKGGVGDTLIVQESGSDLITIGLNAQNECILQLDDSSPKIAILLNEILNEADLRMLKEQEFLNSLTLIRSVASKIGAISLDFEGKKYVVSNNENLTSIQKEIPSSGYFSMLFQSSTRVVFEFRKNEVPEIPDALLPLYDAVILETYKRSSNYSNFGKVNVVRDGIKHIPEWHLAKLCKCLMGGHLLDVKFLMENLEENEGFDRGGVKRDYITTLVAAIQDSKDLFAAVEGSLKLPRIGRRNDAVIPKCTKEEEATFRNLGYLFAYCHRSTPSGGNYEDFLISTGRFFSDALFKAALSINEYDCSSQVHEQIATILLQALSSSDLAENIVSLLELNENSLKSILDDDEKLYLAALYAGEDAYTDDNGDPDIEIITNDKAKFIQDLRTGIYKDKDLIKELKGIPLGSILEPVYQVAKGMQSGMPRGWSSFRKMDIAAVSDKIQGSIDRKKIVAGIQVISPDSIVIKKSNWLKKWVENEATDEELKSFLKFVTGGASLPEGKKLNIAAQTVGQPFPTACTCALILSISGNVNYIKWDKSLWDDTKESFIRNLKQAITVDGFQVK